MEWCSSHCIETCKGNQVVRLDFRESGVDLMSGLDLMVCLVCVKCGFDSWGGLDLTVDIQCV